MFKISKEFDFCYGHRVHNQILNQEYSLDNQCVCRHLHGHQGKITIRLSSDKLTSGMITDFKHLNWFKKFVDDFLDHKFIIDRHDPLYSVIVPANPNFDCEENPTLMYYAIYECSIIDLRTWNVSGPLRELLEGYVIVDFVPTSENLSMWIASIVKRKMDLINVNVDSVEFKETPKTSAEYSVDKREVVIDG
jgi:6-pyruvoyltetrahydropterin/6-carboxytetrahydropterin synthase